MDTAQLPLRFAPHWQTLQLVCQKILVHELFQAFDERIVSVVGVGMAHVFVGADDREAKRLEPNRLCRGTK